MGIFNFKKSKEKNSFNFQEGILPSQLKQQLHKDMSVDKAEEVPDSSLGTQEISEPKLYTFSPEEVQQLYIRNSWVRKYVNTIVKACMRYKIQAIPLNDTEEAKNHADVINYLLKYSNKTEIFFSVRKKYLTDLLLHGNGAIEIEPKVGTPQYLYAAPGYMLRLNTDSKGNIVDLQKAYYFVPPGSSQITEQEKESVVSFPYNSIIHLKLDELSDRIYGISPIQSIGYELTADLKSVKDMSKGDYGIPVQLIKLPKQSRTFVDGVIDKINQILTGHAGNKVVGVNVEAETVKLSDKKYSDEFEFQKWLTIRHNVFGIPPFKLGFVSEVGSMSAREQREEFLSLIETIVQYECDMLTLILVIERFKWKDVSIVSPTLITRLDFEKARVLERLVASGIVTPNEAREKYLGLPRILDEKADQLQLETRQESTTESEVEKALKLKKLEILQQQEQLLQELNRKKKE